MHHSEPTAQTGSLQRSWESQAPDGTCRAAVCIKGVTSSALKGPLNHCEEVDRPQGSGKGNSTQLEQSIAIVNGWGVERQKLGSWGLWYVCVHPCLPQLCVASGPEASKLQALCSLLSAPTPASKPHPAPSVPQILSLFASVPGDAGRQSKEPISVP